MASWVLPVPGSPFTSSGRSSTTAALTAIIRSVVATYRSVPSNFTDYLRQSKLSIYVYYPMASTSFHPPMSVDPLRIVQQPLADAEQI
ncbi:hypothetical protein ACFL1S_07805, partial [Pseudomonadota bacterium]